jgi:Polyketide cyclase / dehydrase and lipid transport
MTTFWISLCLFIGIVGIVTAQNDKKVPQTKVIMTINAPIDTVFRYIVPIELSHIFKRYKSLPAIIKTSNEEIWIKPGLSRTVFFEDGSTSKETLMTVVPSTSFSYHIENFTSQLRFLAKGIDGDWLFIDLGNGQTKIEWTYKVVPKHFIARFIIKSALMKDVNGLLTNALTILKNDLESGVITQK